MNLLYDDTHESQRMALHGARKQAQTNAGRSQADSDRYNGALMRMDSRLNRLLRAFTALPDAERTAFVNRAVSAGNTTEEVRT